MDEHFWNKTDIMERVVHTIVCGMMGGLMTMLLSILPMAHLISNSTHIFIPFVIGAIGVSSYTIKRDKNY